MKPVLALLLAVMAAFSALADGRPTHCDRWKGDAYYRCAKDNYRADRVVIKNRSGRDVSFKIGKSNCGQFVENWADVSYSQGPGEVIHVDFGESGPGACNELFVYSCRIGGQEANCLDAVTVCPKF